LAYAIYALAHGESLSNVEAAIRSRSLAHKGTEKRQSEYVERTLQKASQLIAERQIYSGRER
jgi:hypothetical protein